MHSIGSAKLWCSDLRGFPINSCFDELPVNSAIKLHDLWKAEPLVVQSMYPSFSPLISRPGSRADRLSTEAPSRLTAVQSIDFHISGSLPACQKRCGSKPASINILSRVRCEKNFIWPHAQSTVWWRSHPLTRLIARFLRYP